MNCLAPGISNMQKLQQDVVAAHLWERAHALELATWALPCLPKGASPRSNTGCYPALRHLSTGSWRMARNKLPQKLV